MALLIFEVSQTEHPCSMGKHFNSCAESLTSSGWEAKSAILIGKKKSFLKANLSVQYTWKFSNILKQLAAY